MIAVNTYNLTTPVDAKAGLTVAVALYFAGPDAGGEVDVFAAGDVVVLGAVEFDPRQVAGVCGELFRVGGVPSRFVELGGPRGDDGGIGGERVVDVGAGGEEAVGCGGLGGAK